MSSDAIAVGIYLLKGAKAQTQNCVQRMPSIQEVILQNCKRNLDLYILLSMSAVTTNHTVNPIPSTEAQMLLWYADYCHAQWHSMHHLSFDACIRVSERKLTSLAISGGMSTSLSFRNLSPSDALPATRMVQPWWCSAIISKSIWVDPP